MNIKTSSREVKKKRVHGFVAQQIAEVTPEAVAIQKETLYDIYHDFMCKDIIMHITITDYEGAYNIVDRLNCMFKGGTEDDNIVKEIYKNYFVVDNDLGNEDAIFVNWKIVEDFNTLDKSCIFTLNVSTTQELDDIIIEQKSAITDLTTRLERFEAIINSSLIVDG
jgi:hypothetical protein